MKSFFYTALHSRKGDWLIEYDQDGQQRIYSDRGHNVDVVKTQFTIQYPHALIKKIYRRP